MTAAFLVVASVAALGGAIFLLRQTGAGWRVGRLLAAAPSRSLAEVASMVEHGEVAYVRIAGRVSSEEEFPDENDNPLVYQRRRLQRRGSRADWTTFDEQRIAVPFGLEHRGDHVAIDSEALGDGLVVVPRLSDGRFSDLPDDEAEAGSTPMEPDTTVRLRIEQVSSTDHATAAGVPTRGADGRPTLTAGLGRPLLLTNLEPGAAMRLLAAEQRRSVLSATVLLVLAAVLLAVAVSAVVLGWGPIAGVAAAEPDGSLGPSPAGIALMTPGPAVTPVRDDADVVSAGDPRSEGAGPGLVGNPLVVLLGVITLGLVTAVLTAVVVRLSGRASDRSGRP
ncbi:hypothetical protein BH24CHL9_BH24CHL9_00680 [soil metagenome]